MFKKILIVLELTIVAATSYAPTGWYWQHPLPTGNEYKDVHFIDSNNGFAVGEAGTIIHTEDGGENWSLIEKETTFGDIYSVFFINSTTGWICGEETMLYTNDRGQT